MYTNGEIYIEIYVDRNLVLCSNVKEQNIPRDDFKKFISYRHSKAAVTH